VKIVRTLIFLANLARVIPVSPVMLVDATYHAVEREVASAVTERSGDGGTPAGQIAEVLLVKEAWLVKGLRTSRS
jgi:hypothetical protein